MSNRAAAMVVLAACLAMACADTAMAQQPQSGDSVRPAATRRSLAPISPEAISPAPVSPGPISPSRASPGPNSRGPVSRGPSVVSSPPGDFQTALVSPANYISPFAALFGADSRPSSSDELRSYYQSNSRSRLLDAPEMFGDFRRAGPVLTLTPATNTRLGLQTEIPVAAAISGLRAAENNHALPSDRAWFAYNYFDNAFDVQTDGGFGVPPQSRSQSLHRSVIAVETLLDDGRTSLELRMPFGAAFSSDGVAGTPAADASFGVESESVGNLNLVLKRLLYADPCKAWSVGLGVEAPTGSAGEITYGDISASLEPEAVHFVPFVATTRRSGRWFGHCFLQLDIASHGDPLRATLDTAGEATVIGRIDQPVLLGADIGCGYWLTEPCDCGRGLAVVGELHYTTPLGDQDAFAAAGALTSVAVNTPLEASHELLHFTTGLQLGVRGGWQVRSGVVLPARAERVFDAEYLLQINRSF